MPTLSPQGRIHFRQCPWSCSWFINRGYSLYSLELLTYWVPEVKSLLTINSRIHVDDIRILSDQTPSSISLYVLYLFFNVLHEILSQIIFSVNTGLLTRCVEMFTIQMTTRLIQNYTISACTSFCALASLISVRTFFILAFECLEIDMSQILVAGNTFIYIAFFFCLGRRKYS